ncbi:MAG: ATP-binding cassette domain-containing protein, partial [Phycisphaerales bacterium]
MSDATPSLSDRSRGAAALAVRALTVDYPGVRALDGVSVEFRAGEIHAVVGENGAGKSTLMKVLSGSVRPTSGEVLADGRSVAFAKPSEALRAGIAMVHQELNLVPTLSVADNVMLGREEVRGLGVVVHASAQRARASHLLGLLGAEVGLSRMAGSLSVAEAQFVEIAKCLASDARVLIFDEPTAVLGEHEAAKLLALMRRLRDEGRAVIFISHHLDEGGAVADRVSVLRDGRLVQEFTRGDGGAMADEDSLARAMVGRELGSIYPAKGAARDDAPHAIELVGFGAEGRSRGISLAVRPGEIVGIAGLVGSGRT